jgi:hypothetical protein
MPISLPSPTTIDIERLEKTDEAPGATRGIFLSR